MAFGDGKPDQHKCYCGRDKIVNQTTQIGICQHCDIEGSPPWPSGYRRWYRGMPYPGERHES